MKYIIGNLQKKYLHGLFLDLRKAYDSVPHQGLLNKHKNIGIRGNVKNWFIDYFKNRKQKGRIDKEESRKGYTTRNLGSLIFLIYINDINIIEDDNMKQTLFA